MVFSFIYPWAVYLANFMATLWHPFWLAHMPEIVLVYSLSNLHFFPYIIQRAGVATISEVLSAVIEVIMGNMFGPIVILSGIIQGMGP